MVPSHAICSRTDAGTVSFATNFQRAARAALLVLAMAWPGMAAADGMRRETVTLETSAGAVAISAEIALSAPEQEQGLMFRRSIGENEGMLFVYDKPQHVSMWMRNTYLSLDMVFIGRDRRVLRIEHGATPLSDAVIDSGGPVQFVLELKAGMAERLGLKAGDVISSRALP